MLTAITGGIAEGKSTVLEFLEKQGYSVASADKVSRDLFDLSEVNGQLAQLAGVERPITRQVLRERIIDQPTLRRAVNKLMHPMIMSTIREMEVEFVEVPLLIEACLQGEYDEIWVVTCGIAEQRKRLADRYGAGTDVDRILDAQLPTSTKLAFADWIIRTDQPKECVFSDVLTALSSR